VAHFSGGRSDGPVYMKRMLIVGNEYAGIKSVPLSEVESINIADYQVVLIDLSDNFEIGVSSRRHMTRCVYSLINNDHPVIYFLPRVATDLMEILPFNITITPKSGKTLSFQEDDGLMRLYKNYLTEHRIIIGNVAGAYTIGDNNVRTFVLIWNNVNEICGFSSGSLYVLHAPDVRLRKAAVESIVDYFSPDLEGDVEERFPWVPEFEVEELHLQEVEREILEVEKQLSGLETKRNEKLIEKEHISRWSDLVTKQGKLLEFRLKEALEFLGVEKVIHEPNGVHGPDLEIVHQGMCFTVEVEGSKGSIKIEKARELLHWIADAPPNYKGVLIGNPFREINPIERPPSNHRLFVKEAEELARNRNFVLISSHDIFKLVSKKIGGQAVDVGKILSLIYESRGDIALV
jgi:hypothetical protein